MKYLSFHFSTKIKGFTDNQKASILNMLHATEGKVTLVHAFASREFLNSRNIPTDVLDFFDKFFPQQVSFFNEKENKPMRFEMFSFMSSKNNSESIFVGDHEVSEGTKEEYQLAHDTEGLSVSYIDPAEFSDAAASVLFN